jgi:sterol desaturase/sphingolipid hydroxylase (fatty acid hydroxylase superfamily)
VPTLLHAFLLDPLLGLLSPSSCIRFALLAFFLLAERLRPLDAVQEPLWKRLRRHGGLMVVGALIAPVVGAFAGLMDPLTNRVGAFGWHMMLTERVGHLGRVQLLLTVLASDFITYVTHRWQHAVPVFWRIHRVHHSDPKVDATTELRFHPLDDVAGLLLSPVYAALVGWMMMGRRGLIAFMFPSAWGLFQHANVRLPRRLDRALSWVFCSPGVHRAHHSSVVQETDSNFGNVFSIWDRLFGTFKYVEHPAAMGLRELDDERWQTLVGMMLTPFRRVRAVRSRAMVASVRPGPPAA